MSYEKDERETIINTDDESGVWNVYTRQRKIITKLKNLGYEPFNVELEGEYILSCEFSIPVNKISFRNANTKARAYTEEQKEAMRQRLAEARNKEKTGDR